jgi:WD40 repeat protein
MQGLLVAVIVGPCCWIFELHQNQSASLNLLVKFRADFSEYESELSCITFVSNGILLTGGGDGVIREWKLSLGVSDPSQRTSYSLDSSIAPHGMPVEIAKVGDTATREDVCVTLLKEYRCHGKRIKSISVDGFSRNLVVSTSEDQSCHLWRLTEGRLLCKLSLESAIRSLNSPNITSIPPRIQFRCAVFSRDGNFLYTVLSRPKGASLLVKWTPSTCNQTDEASWQWSAVTGTVTEDEPMGCIALR